MNFSADKLILGTAQLGFAYGATNRVGDLSDADAASLALDVAHLGIRSFDTARAYGESERRLGLAFAKLEPGSIRIITKLSPLANLPDHASQDEARSAVEISLRESCDALRRERLDVVLLHRWQHWSSHQGAIRDALLVARKDGRVGKLGASVQNPTEAIEACGFSEIEVIQLPFNLLDRRWHSEDFRSALLAAERKIEIHARSIFLQGILLDSGRCWPRLDHVDAEKYIAALFAAAARLAGGSLTELCLRYAASQDWIDRLVIGAESAQQISEILRLMAKGPFSEKDLQEIEAMVPKGPEELINPSFWNKN